MEPRRRFSNEFKLDAVLLTLQNDRTVKEVSEEMDIPYSLLCKWRTKYKKLGEKAFVGKRRHPLILVSLPLYQIPPHESVDKLIKDFLSDIEKYKRGELL